MSNMRRSQAARRPRRRSVARRHSLLAVTTTSAATRGHRTTEGATARRPPPTPRRPRTTTAPPPRPGTDTTDGRPPTAPTPPRRAATCAMTVTFDLNPDAVWDDGSPITVGRLRVHVARHAEHARLAVTVGYDQITVRRAGHSDKQVVVDFSEVYAPVQDAVRPRSSRRPHVADCNDVSADFATEMPISGRSST